MRSRNPSTNPNPAVKRRNFSFQRQCAAPARAKCCRQKGKNPKSSCMMRQNNFIQAGAGNVPRDSSHKDAVGIVSQHQHAGSGLAPRRHDHQSCRRTRGTSIRNPRRSCRRSPPASVRARILPSARQRGLRVAVCRSGTWSPCQRNTRCLNGGFRILGYPGSAIRDRAASRQQESISSPHFRHLATATSSRFGLTICTVSLPVLWYFPRSVLLQIRVNQPSAV